jgi:hypothetical protein
MRPTIAVLAVLALAAPAGALAATSTLKPHRIAWSQTAGGARTGASASFYVPSAWRTLPRRDARHLSFRVQRPSCGYSVTFTSSVADGTDETAAARVAAALPATGSRLVDSGTRGAAAWRVTHPASTDGRVHLSALRVDRREVAPGRFAWRQLAVSAVSRAGSECHAGTYRASLGPQIGDALATAPGGAYVIAERG